VTTRPRDGASGWDEYAPFYDWENARTLGRRDVAFWRELARRENAPLLELGCGTGRLLAPLARTGVPVTGVDRSAGMLRQARVRIARVPRATRPAVVRADIRALPFRPRAFGFVLAPYGMLQSLVSDDDLGRTIAEAARLSRRGGLFGVDLVPDLPRWAAHGPRVTLRGRRPGGARITLTESVRQDRRRGLTIFDETYVERRGRAERHHAFTLTFRTLSVPEMTRRVEQAGFRLEALLGDYRGGPWDERANVWVLLFRRR
jgi:SAM-dependent methyltransferase